MPDPNIAPDAGGGKGEALKCCIDCGKAAAMTFHGQCRSCFIDSYDEPEDDDPDHFDDCGLMPNGQCLKAGSEECDWECGRLR